MLTLLMMGILGGAFAAGLIWYAFLLHERHLEVPVPIACTDEAKVCPDGSTVGRVAPSCEFAACPPAASSSEPSVLPGHLFATTTRSGISITPRAVIEDSRCPVDVLCVQAGTVCVLAHLSSGNHFQDATLTLGTPYTYSGKDVLLEEVTPSASSKHAIAPSEYQFSFSVSDITPAEKGRLIGTLDLGPMCPVERSDNPCTPTPEQYAAYPIGIYADEAESKLIATATPDANGAYAISLDPGSYYVDLQKKRTGIGSVTGVPTHVFIQSSGTVTVPITIDTGIR